MLNGLLIIAAIFGAFSALLCYASCRVGSDYDRSQEG
jgi:hypothetical protein